MGGCKQNGDKSDAHVSLPMKDGAPVDKLVIWTRSGDGLTPLSSPRLIQTFFVHLELARLMSFSSLNLKFAKQKMSPD